MRKILVIGATSAIAEHCSRIWITRGDSLFLVARNEERLASICNDLRVRGAANVSSYTLDVNDFNSHASMLEIADHELRGIDTVLIAHGTLSIQEECEMDVLKTLSEIQTNALSVVALLTHIANRFERQRKGTIAVISSVAGDRGRAINYVYGSSKALVTAFTSGLRQRLRKSNVSVVTIKPGYVDTPMTAAFKKGIIWTKPSKIAKQIVEAVDHNKSVVYAPIYWRVIMLVIKALPERIFVNVFK